MQSEKYSAFFFKKIMTDSIALTEKVRYDEIVTE